MSWALSLVLTLLCAALPCAARAADAEAADALARLLSTRAVRGARIGVAVVDLQSGEVLVERHSRRPMVPASNQKLLVAAAALRHWGPAHRFETPILVETPLAADGVVEGPLWIVGSGDPSLVSESLWKLAEELSLKGVREIRGGIAVDVSHFDSRTTHEDWEPISSRAYYARVGALAANYSSFRIEVASGAEPGRPASVRIAPNVSYFRLRTEAPTISRPAPILLDLQRLPDGSGELLHVKGAVGIHEKPRTHWRAVRLPARYAVSILRSQLEAQGVRVHGGVQFGAAPEGAIELLRFPGAPVAEMVRRLNKYSNNFIAEQLFKQLGADWSGGPGSWEAGSQAVRELLTATGAIDAGTVIADGSGLSPRNRVSPHSLVTVIQQTSADFSSGPEFLASLPLGGLDGTLEKRLEGSTISLRGKTGHLRHVASLSGVMSAADGRRLAFSVMVNGGRGGREAVDDAIDAFVSGVAGWGGEVQPTAQGMAGD